jgi:hypothetical protein
MARLRKLRERSVSVRVITNSLAVSDEPMATIALERHQRELLAMGVELYELSSERIRHDRHLHRLIGSSTVGCTPRWCSSIAARCTSARSLDGRSADINTEIGVRFESAEIALMLFRTFRVEEAAGVYRVRLAANELHAPDLSPHRHSDSTVLVRTEHTSGSAALQACGVRLLPASVAARQGVRTGTPPLAGCSGPPRFARRETR